MTFIPDGPLRLAAAILFGAAIDATLSLAWAGCSYDLNGVGYGDNCPYRGGKTSSINSPAGQPQQAIVNGAQQFLAPLIQQGVHDLLYGNEEAEAKRRALIEAAAADAAREAAAAQAAASLRSDKSRDNLLGNGGSGDGSALALKGLHDGSELQLKTSNHQDPDGVSATAPTPGIAIAAAQKALDCGLQPMLSALGNPAFSKDVQSEAQRVLSELSQAPTTGQSNEQKIYSIGRDTAVHTSTGESQAILKMGMQRLEDTGVILIDINFAVVQPHAKSLEGQTVAYITPKGNVYGDASGKSKACLGL